MSVILILLYFIPLESRKSAVPFPTSAALICAGQAFVALIGRTSLGR